LQKYPSLSNLGFLKNLNLEKAAEHKKSSKEQARVSNTLTPRKDRQIATKREREKNT